MNAQFQSLSLREQVDAEAMANGYRRESARQVGATVRGLRGPTAPLYSFGDHIRELANELDAEERRELQRRINAPSDLIATMKREWPDQSAAVKAWADAEGLSLGEAWARLIGMAVASLRDGGG